MQAWRQFGAEWRMRGALRGRIIALAGAAAVALAMGFVMPSPAQADAALRRTGYFLMLAAFAGFAAALLGLAWRERATLRMEVPKRSAVFLAAALAVIYWVALVGEPRGFKVVNDEFVLQATALNLHLEREPAALVRAYHINGVFTPLFAYTDKRPFFYPFLVSLLHDLTGYRVANAFLLNHALAAVSLALVFMLAHRVCGNREAAVAATALWGGLPLFAQNANGSGMELLNVTLLALLMLLSWDYLRAPDELRAHAIVLTAVLLAQTRYESALFVPIAGLVIVSGWRVAGRVILPWSAIAAPLLLLPYGWQHQITTANKALWELQADQTSRFSVEYLWGNLTAARHFFFAWGNRLIANSWLLSAASAAALVGLAVMAVRRRVAVLGPQFGVVVLSAGALANLTLVMFYYWGRLNDPVAARLALPALMVGTLSTAWLLGLAAKNWIHSGWFVAATFVYVLGFMRPQMANGHYTALNQAVQQLTWEKGFLRERPPAERLIISNKTVLPWIIEQQPAIGLNHARQREQELRFHLATRTFGEIIVMQRLQPSSPGGDFLVDPADALPAQFRLETLGEKRFGASLARISRLVSVDAASPLAKPTGS